MKLRKIILEVVVRDRDGHVVARRRKRAGYLANLTRFLRICLYGTSDNLVDITGTSRSWAYNGTRDTWLIRVGSGTTPQTPNDYSLVSELGTGAATYGSVIVIGSNSQFTISGAVTIPGGGTVQEVGYSERLATYHTLLLRDVVPAVVVPPGGSCTVTYTLIFTA